MVRHLHFENIFHIFPDILHPRIRELHDFARVNTNKMVMPFKFVRPFKLGAIVAKLVFCHQVAVQKEFNGIIKRGAADPVFVILHADIKSLDIEMTVSVIDFLKYSKSFRRLPMSPLFEVIGEDFLDRFK